MNRIRLIRIRRLATALAGLALTWLGLAVAAPAAFAVTEPAPDGGSVGGAAGSGVVTDTRTVIMGGMPGWQIALIAMGAALVSAGVAVLAYRARAAHRRTALSAA
jgi:hypothetical protein